MRAELPLPLFSFSFRASMCDSVCLWRERENEELGFMVAGGPASPANTPASFETKESPFTFG